MLIGSLRHAVRYALTLRVMLASLKRKLGVVTPVGMPGQPDMMAPAFIDPAIMPQLQFTVEELGMLPGSLPNDRAMFSPSAIPVWLQEQVRLPYHVHSWSQS